MLNCSIVDIVLALEIVLFIMQQRGAFLLLVILGLLREEPGTRVCVRVALLHMVVRLKSTITVWARDN